MRELGGLHIVVKVAVQRAVPLVRRQVVHGGHRGPVLGDLHGANTALPQEVVDHGRGRTRLRFNDDQVGARDLGSVRAQRAPRQRRVHRRASHSTGQQQGVALVGASQDRLEGGHQVAVSRLLNLAGHPLSALTRERSPGLVPRDRHALLDGHAARAAGLDLQEGRARREVGAGADLEATAALERSQQVRIHVGSVVVGGGVALGHLAVDLEDPGFLGEAAQNRRGRGGVQRVLAVHSGQHRRALIQFIEADRVEVGENRVQGGVHESCPW